VLLEPFRDAAFDATMAGENTAHVGHVLLIGPVAFPVIALEGPVNPPGLKPVELLEGESDAETAPC
jgi:hypothetical protein